MKVLSRIVFLGLLFVIYSCGVNSNLMFKTKDADNKVITDDIPITPEEAYRLAPEDKFIFTLYSNKGKRIIEVVSGVGGTQAGGTQRIGMTNSIDYWIRPDGKVNLPLVGDVDLAGLTVKESQDLLSELYAKEGYTSPYVQLEVTNRRVLVFPGKGGQAQVVPIVNNNTTLLEAIALAGGIDERGKSKIIKVMRKTSEGRVTYQMDLSSLDGLKYADMIVQANDYIYVEPSRQLGREVFAEIGPYLSIITTSAFITFSIIRMLNTD